MRVDSEVLDRSMEEGARVVALALLGDGDREAERLARAEDDAEALHDFRVALRRLRTALRAFRPWLGESVGRRAERRLKKLAGATNAARDAEVQLAWLSTQEQGLAPRQLPGLECLSRRFRGRLAVPGTEQDQLLERYARTSRRLAKRLATYEERVGAREAEDTFGGAVARLLAEQLEAVRDLLGKVRGASDQECVHDARIAAKRLRYLLEPLRGNRHADAREAVKALKALQDVLGELHDSHVLAGEIGAALAEVATERARELHAAIYERGASGSRPRRDSPRPGLLALLRLVRERRDALFAQLGHDWLADGRMEALIVEVKALTGALEARAGGKVETERRYLLGALPPRVEGAQAVEIDEGWLPGARLRERLRRTRGPEGERYWRAVEQGGGPLRREAVEEAPRALFEALWPLTEGRRLSIRRWEVEDGRLPWTVDRVVDRDLVLAAVTLPAGVAEVTLPEWLRPLVAREVTDDAAYASESLALRAPAAQASQEAAATPVEGAGGVVAEHV